MKEAMENFEKYMKEEKSVPREEKPLRVVYIDMKKKKRVKNSQMKEEDKAKTEEIKDKSMYPKTKLLKEKEDIKGENNKFPNENFIKLEVTQKNRKINLATYKYDSKDENRLGVVFLFHGLFEYANRNAYVAKLMADKGFDVVSFDLRGHGKSEGIRGYFDNIDTLVDDSEKFVKETIKIYPEDTPKFLFGFSFGNILCSLLSLRMTNTFKGMILFAPPFNHNFDKYKFWIKIGYFLHKFFPTLKLLKIKEKPTENKEILKWTLNDPLVYHDRVRIGTGITIIEGQEQASIRAKDINTPFYLLHGKDDTVTDYRGSEKFYKEVAIKDKTIIVVDDLDHEVIRNENIERYMEDVCFWMKQRAYINKNI